MSFLPPLLAIGLLGYISASSLFSSFETPNRWLKIVLALPLGFGLVSLLLFFSFLIAGSKGPELCLSICLLTGLYLMLLKSPPLKEFRVAFISPVLKAKTLLRHVQDYFARLHQGTPQERYLFKLELAACLFSALVLFHYWDYFWGQVTWNAFGGWDARYFWKLKARFYFRDPSQWQGMFSAIPGDWAHPDYPLMLPGAFASIWFLMGRETLLGPILVSLIFSLSLIALIFWYLSSAISKTYACLASAFLMSVYMWRFWSTTLYADIPLTFFMTAAGICLVLYVRSSSQNPRFLLAAGLFTGLSLWTKDEGIFFSAWMTIVITAASLVKKENLRGILRAYGIFLAGLAAPLLASLIVKTFLGTTGGQYLGSGRSASNFLFLLLGNPAKTQIISAVFGIFAINFKQWNGLWLLFAFAALAGGKKAYANGRWIFFSLTLLLWAGYFVILHVTPYDLRFQIETALLRIMSHAMGLGIIFAAEALSASERETA